MKFQIIYEFDTRQHFIYHQASSILIQQK